MKTTYCIVISSIMLIAVSTNVYGHSANYYRDHPDSAKIEQKACQIALTNANSIEKAKNILKNSDCRAARLGIKLHKKQVRKQQRDAYERRQERRRQAKAKAKARAKAEAKAKLKKAKQNFPQLLDRYKDFTFDKLLKKAKSEGVFNYNGCPARRPIDQYSHCKALTIILKKRIPVHYKSTLDALKTEDYSALKRMKKSHVNCNGRGLLKGFTRCDAINDAFKTVYKIRQEKAQHLYNNLLGKYKNQSTLKLEKKLTKIGISVKSMGFGYYEHSIYRECKKSKPLLTDTPKKYSDCRAVDETLYTRYKQLSKHALRNKIVNACLSSVFTYSISDGGGYVIGNRNSYPPLCWPLGRAERKQILNVMDGIQNASEARKIIQKCRRKTRRTLSKLNKKQRDGEISSTELAERRWAYNSGIKIPYSDFYRCAAAKHLLGNKGTMNGELLGFKFEYLRKYLKRRQIE
jgi:hypothetical protein